MCCDKNCIANLNGVCCVGECRGQICVFKVKPKRNCYTAEKCRKIYEFLKETFGEDFECDENVFEDEED